MAAFLFILSLLITIYSIYRQSRRVGRWYLWGFLAVLGAMALFVLCYIIPLVRSEYFENRPELMVALLLGGILVFVTALIYVARKWSTRMVQASQTMSPESTIIEEKSPSQNES